MSKKALFIAFLPVHLFILSCQTQIDTDSESRRLLQADRDFSALSVEIGAAQAFHRFMTTDALQLPHRHEPIMGRDAIRDSMLTAGEATLTWEPQKAVVAKSGELGWTWGVFEIKGPAEDGSMRIGHGKYLNIWEKQDDGSWKVAVDIGNASPPPAQGHK